MKLNEEINSWLIVLVILLTAGIASWVMLKDKPNRNRNFAYYYSPQQVAQNFSPALMGMGKNWALAAGTTGIPVIRAGAVSLHADRGVCTNCHTVTSSRGKPIPTISATARMPHDYRGVCSNCHLLVVNTGTNGRQAVNPVAMVGQAAAPQAAAAARPVAEGEWLGLEVTPITSLTAVQYGIAPGTQGLVVAEAEAQALTAGVKAGDVVLSINGVPIYNLSDFFRATRNGALMGGVLEILRKGLKLVINMAQTPPPPLAARANLPAVMVGQAAAPQAAAAARPVAEGEWLGLEVTPITSLTAVQYGIAPGTQGLVVAEAEAQALTAGVKAGDVVLSINGVPISNLGDFFRATRNGALMGGVLEILRKGLKLAINMAQTPPPAIAANPNIPVNAGAVAWGGGGQRLDNIGDRGLGVGSPRQF